VKVILAAVGRPGPPLRDAIAEYETRAGRYWPLQVVEVKETRGGDDARIVADESERLVARVPDGVEQVALTRKGERWSSRKLARFLQEKAVHGHPGAAFLIGGALGLSDETLSRARHRLSLSSFTMPHELARLVLAEQLYRAGTIVRGEPYHKG